MSATSKLFLPFSGSIREGRGAKVHSKLKSPLTETNEFKTVLFQKNNSIKSIHHVWIKDPGAFTLSSAASRKHFNSKHESLKNTVENRFCCAE